MSELKLTVLGKSPAWEDAGGACSGYLVESPGGTLLVDCGHGVVSELRHHIDPARLDAVFITHLHADHFFDLVPLAYLLRFAPPPTGMPERRPQLYLPAGGIAALRLITSIWNSGEMIEESFSVIEYEAESEFELAGLTAKLASVPHFVPTTAIRVQSQDRAGITFGADCGPNEALPQLAEGSDLVICEATMPVDQPNAEDGHLSAAQAGEIAAAANARELLVTHFSDLYDRDWVLTQACRRFDGTTTLAFAGWNRHYPLAG